MEIMSSFELLINDIVNMSDEDFAKKKDSLKEMIESFKGNQQLINETKTNFIRAGLSVSQLISEKEEVFKNFHSMIQMLDISPEKDELLFALNDFVLQIYNEVIDDNMRPSFLVPIELCHENARIPEYKHKGDAGVDFYLVEDIEIPAHQTTIVKTGLKMAIPTGYELQIRPRSGTSLKTPLRIANAPGTVDCTYRDEIGILAWNTSNETLRFEKGDRIAQGVLCEVPMMKFEQVEDVTFIGENRHGGFGSTGQ